MTFRRSTQLGLWLGLSGVVLVVLLAHAGYRQEAELPRLAREAALVGQLGLSDLCLFTEASYTRHLALADLFTPFQEYPLSSEHFPSGALVAPPAQLTGGYGRHH